MTTRVSEWYGTAGGGECNEEVPLPMVMMTRMPTSLDALAAAVKADPGDRTARLAYADELDAVGDMETLCPRCVGERGRGSMIGVICPECLSSGVIITRNREKAALMRVLAEPESDERRLQWADAVQDRDAARAEFVRVQCAPGSPRPCEFCDWLGREDNGDELYCSDCDSTGRYDAQILGAHGDHWFALPGGMREVVEGRSHHHNHAVVRRGFVSQVTCPAAAWLEHGDRLTEEHPVEVVRLTGVIDCGVKLGSVYLNAISGGRGVFVTCGEASLESCPTAREALAAKWPTVREWHLPAA